TKLDLAKNVLGAIPPAAEPAREAARIVAAFYISAMPRELLERNGVDPASVEPAVEAFARGEVTQALDLTPQEVTDALTVAGTAQDWLQGLGGGMCPRARGRVL